MAEIYHKVLQKNVRLRTNFIKMSTETASLLGYAASFFVVLSFILKDLQKVRMVNLVGCILFVIYGIFSGMLWPVILPNAILCFVQLYHLIKKS